MRPLAIVGLVLALFGAWVTFTGGSFTTREKVLEVGDVSISADKEHPIPGWVGIVAIVVGAGLVVGGMKAKG